jgi:cell division protein FtsQ
MSIDPRLIERRKVVAEDKARRNVRRLLRLLAVATLVGAGVWLMLSPFMSISEISVTGVQSSGTRDVLEAHRVIPGTPMILFQPSSVEARIEEDQWVIGATVGRRWPTGVFVSVEERVPAAWVQTSSGWWSRSIDGVALTSVLEPDESLGWVRLSSIPDGNAVDSPLVLGAIEFVAALPPDLTSDVIVRVEDNGELWAVVSGYQVRLGRPVEMTKKALSLDALLGVDPPRGAVLTLIAPTNPAVTPRHALTSTEEDDLGEQP